MSTQQQWNTDLW